MPLHSFDSLLNLSTRGQPALSAGKPTPEHLTAAGTRRITAIVAKGKNGFHGLEVESIVDIAESSGGLIDSVRDRIGVVGNTFIRDHNVTIIDIDKVITKSQSA